MRKAAVQEELRWIKAVIKEEVQKAGCRLVKLYLFGSRAKGTHSPQSDWDLYAVVDKDLPFAVKRKVGSAVRWRLAQRNLLIDVFIQSEHIAEKRRNNPGFLTHYALKEGVEL
ncbi:MAG: nucleotidyltransferase domain-containing protein [Planctomycetota bacterium]|nr:MAG: nucleotidyltransferase domain-containing protein [Planctomycetota bacterium]